MKIYIAAMLTHAPEDYKTATEKLRAELKKDFDVLDYFGLGPGEASDVYMYDKKCLDDCDMVLAEVSHPSLGVGYEIAYGLAQGKKVMAFAKTDANVGRLMRGITDPNYRFLRYDNQEDILKEVKKLL